MTFLLPNSAPRFFGLRHVIYHVPPRVRILRWQARVQTLVILNSLHTHTQTHGTCLSCFTFFLSITAMSRYPCCYFCKLPVHRAAPYTYVSRADPVQCFSKFRWGRGPDRKSWGPNGYFSVKIVKIADFLGAPAKNLGAGGPSGPDLLNHCKSICIRDIGERERVRDQHPWLPRIQMAR